MKCKKEFFIAYKKNTLNRRGEFTMDEKLKNIEKEKNKSTNKKKFVKIKNPYDPADYKSGRSYYNKAVVNNLKKEFNPASPRKTIFLIGKEGSGKSSTLNRIKRDANILGDRFVVIYVALNQVVSGSNVNFFAELYKNLRKSVDMYQFPSFDDELDSLKLNITFEDIRDFFLILKSHLHYKESIILLILDDFEKFFETENVETYLPVIKLFKKLSEEENKFRVLLSGNNEIHKDLFDSEVEDWLKNVFRIKMKTIAPKEFKELIIEPVKTQVTYSTSALEEIKSITGVNLYCQQLLCHYIIEYLNNSQKYNCEKKDVNTAAEVMIGDKRDDFEYFWKKHSYEDRIVFSALVDDNIISKRGRHYFIEPESLLEEIFEPNELKNILIRLYNKEFINMPAGRRFEEYPFNIPLYGNWIKKNHAFLKQVVENIETIAAKKDFSKLGKIIKKIPKELFPADQLCIIEFTQEWFELQNTLEKKARVDRDRIGQMLRKICKILELPVKEHAHPGIDYFIIEFDKMNIGSIEEAFFLIQDRIEPSQADMQHVRDAILNQIKTIKPCLFLCFKKTRKIEELEEKTFLNIIIIDGNDLKNILFSLRPRQVLKDIILKRISSSQISPYQTKGPAITTFYGRRKERERILSSSNKSFIILGARRIGKSTLLMRIKKELDELGAYCIYMDLEFPVNPTYETFLANIKSEFERFFKKEFSFNYSLTDFANEIKKLDIGKKRMVIILDEVDELLQFDKDNGYQLTRCFRKLFHEGCCQFIFSGFAVLQLAERDRKSPLFNFCEEMELGPLEEKYALDLVTEPMANIAIKYNNPVDKHIILEYTSYHPNLMQFFCRKLVERIADRTSNRRMILQADIQNLFNSEYENYILNDFYMFYDDLDNLEKFFILILINCDSGENEFSITSINNQLKRKEINLSENKIHRTLQKLKLRFILVEEGQGNYTFAIPHFPEILKKRNDPSLLKSLKQRIKDKNYGKSESL